MVDGPEERVSVSTRSFPYRHGTEQLTGVLAVGEGVQRRPGVVLFHEGSGLGPHVVAKAARLAEHGYVALAADMYGRARTGDPSTLLTVDEAMQLMSPFLADAELLRTRAGAAVAAIRTVEECDPERVAVAGFCFGGMVALELARAGSHVAAAASFHGVLTTAAPAERGAVTASVLVCTGSDDVLAPPSDRAALEQELAAAGADWQMVVYGGAKHSFTNPDVDGLGMDDFRYDRAADARSWTALLQLLDETFNAPIDGAG
jgi:dienelactone hydrolase